MLSAKMNERNYTTKLVNLETRTKQQAYIINVVCSSTEWKVHGNSKILCTYPNC